MSAPHSICAAADDDYYLLLRHWLNWLFRCSKTAAITILLLLISQYNFNCFVQTLRSEWRKLNYVLRLSHGNKIENNCDERFTNTHMHIRYAVLLNVWIRFQNSFFALKIQHAKSLSLWSRASSFIVVFFFSL